MLLRSIRRLKVPKKLFTQRIWKNTDQKNYDLPNITNNLDISPPQPKISIFKEISEKNPKNPMIKLKFKNKQNEKIYLIDSELIEVSRKSQKGFINSNFLMSLFPPLIIYGYFSISFWFYPILQIISTSGLIGQFFYQNYYRFNIVESFSISPNFDRMEMFSYNCLDFLRKNNSGQQRILFKNQILDFKVLDNFYRSKFPFASNGIFFITNTVLF